MKNKTIKKYIYLSIIIVSLISFFYFENNSIVTTEYSISSTQIPESFNGFKIVQLSDLHSKSFGKKQDKLVEKVKNTNPNIIVVSGDLVDSDRYNEVISLLLMEKLVQIAPVYFVTGNHEWWSGKFESLEAKLNDLGIHVMRDSSEEISNDADNILITGIDDPAQMENLYSDQSIVEDAINDSMKKFQEYKGFKILLSHRPELFSQYSQFDLVLCGHAHGGQFRIPFIGGLVAPNQGLFPKYTSGEYILQNTKMIVNRGLGNSVIPIRLLNRPEIVVITCSR